MSTRNAAAVSGYAPARVEFVCDLIGRFLDAILDERIALAMRLERRLSAIIRDEFPGRIFNFCNLAIFVAPTTPVGKVEQVEMIRAD